MIVYIQPPNIYFEIAAYVHAEGMYGCVTRYLVLYMRFWSTCLFFMKLSLPASPITRCVHYPDRLVPGMYVLPTLPVNWERPVSGRPHLLNVLAPGGFIQKCTVGVCVEVNYVVCTVESLCVCINCLCVLRLNP